MAAPNFWKTFTTRLLTKELFFVTTPWWLRRLYRRCTWDISTSEKVIYLSFDDGPHPSITPFVLEQLRMYNAKATFFCIGDNVRKYPAVYQQVINEGHAVGNHTMHHINGWKSADERYLSDINEAKQYIHSGLFRPPYGRIKRSQLRRLAAEDDQLATIMWSVLAGDWMASLSPEQCFLQVKKAVYPGCIIVFHDSEKANDRMSYALPKLLDHCTKAGYLFKKIEENNRKIN